MYEKFVDARHSHHRLPGRSQSRKGKTPFQTRNGVLPFESCRERQSATRESRTRPLLRDALRDDAAVVARDLVAETAEAGAVVRPRSDLDYVEPPVVVPGWGVGDAQHVSKVGLVGEPDPAVRELEDVRHVVGVPRHVLDHLDHGIVVNGARLGAVHRHDLTRVGDTVVRNGDRKGTHDMPSLA